jgi:putative SOS response-associated peptidase YedK
MCGRFALTTPIKELVELFEIEQNLCELGPSYNIAPGREIAALVLDEKRKLVQFKWGLIPSWAKDPAIGNRMINARAETIHQKPSFKGSFKKRRCLIIANGFFEWKKVGREKVPVFIRLKSGEPFGFAGLYDFWQSSDGRRIGTCTIITTDANELVQSIHNRMPVIVRKDQERLWLDCSIDDEQSILPLLAPFDASQMEAFEVSKAVNSPENNTEECIKPDRKNDSGIPSL